MIKVLFMIPSLEIGGAQVFCADLCNELSKDENYEVHLAVSFNIINAKFSYLFSNNKIHIHILEKTKGFSFTFLLRLGKLIKQLKPDIINTHTSFTLRYLLLLPFVRKINIIHTITNNPRQYNKKLFPLYKRRMHQKSWNHLTFVAISDRIADTLSEVYSYDRSKIKVIYNGIKPLICKQFPSKKYDLLNCGSLTDIKNQDLLIESCSYLKDLKLTTCIVGDGPNYDRYVKLIETYSLGDNVILAGKSPDPSSYYFESKIFILTSKTEGNPITILEAFSAGLPVIAPNVGGIPDLIEDGINGYLFNTNIAPKDLASLIRKVNCLPPDRIKTISETNKNKVKQWYIDKIAHEYSNLFDEVLDK